MKHLNKIRVFTFVLMLMAGGLCSTAKAEPDTTAADLMYLVAADNSLKLQGVSLHKWLIIK